MKEKVEFKYNIGDKVTINNPLIKGRKCRFDEIEFENVISKKEYEIKGYGWVIDDNGFWKYYQLHANNDPYIEYHNRILECDLNPSGDSHRFEYNVDTSDVSGDEILYGDKVYAGFFDNLKNERKVRYSFSFVSFGAVNKIQMFFNGEYERVDVYVKREFLCTFSDGSKRLDGCREGEVHGYPINNVMKKIPDWFAEDFSIAISKDDFFLRNFFDTKSSWNYEYREWLIHMGIYDKVVEILNNLPTSKKKKEVKPKKDKLQSIIDKLTPDEREKLKSML